MNIEHVAINVEDTLAMVEWYVEHLEMQVLRGMTTAPYTHFIADKAGRSVIEVYSNPSAAVPDYAAMNPLILHFAFAVEDIEGTRDRLIAAGATLEGEIATTPNDDQLAMLRDPWGICVQLVKRKKAML